MQLKHLAEADCSVEGARDEVGDARVSLCFISVPLLELEFTEEGHKVIHSQVDVHKIGLTVFLKECKVERICYCSQEEVSDYITSSNK